VPELAALRVTSRRFFSQEQADIGEPLRCQEFLELALYYIPGLFPVGTRVGFQSDG
jgi:hypothetical protein